MKLLHTFLILVKYPHTHNPFSSTFLFPQLMQRLITGHSPENKWPWTLSHRWDIDINPPHVWESWENHGSGGRKNVWYLEDTSAKHSGTLTCCVFQTLDFNESHQEGPVSLCLGSPRSPTSPDLWGQHLLMLTCHLPLSLAMQTQ